MMLSIFPEAADFTLVGLGKGRKKGGLLALFSAGHRCPFGPKARCTFLLLPGCDSDRSIYNLGRAFEARARKCRSESIRVPINRRRVSARRFPRQSNWSLERMIRMQPSVSAISACLRPVIYSRSLAV